MPPLERQPADRDAAHRYDVVIVGAGRAGARAAAALRASGFAGSLLMVGGDPVSPHGRPPPPQSYLLGSIVIERRRPDEGDFWNALRIDLVPGLAVVALDARARTLTLAAGRVFAFGRCIVAAGAGVSLRASRRSGG